MSTTGEAGLRPLSRERVLQAGLALIDAEGLPALTMRRLAADLGVGVMSLYRHVSTKEDLLDGITHLALKGLITSDPVDVDWADYLSRKIRNLYSALRRHPGATQILASGLIPGPVLDPVRDSLLGVLRTAGFNERQSVTYLHTLFTYTVGFAVVAGHNDVRPEQDIRRVSSLPAKPFRFLSASANQFSQRFNHQSFDAGLALIVTGLRAQLDSQDGGTSPQPS